MPIGFGGCLKNIRFQDMNEDLYLYERVTDLANINLDGCPPYHQPKLTCRDELMQVDILPVIIEKNVTFSNYL